MLRKNSLFLSLLLIVFLVSSCGQQQKPVLSEEKKISILNELADTPSVWRGWELLHREDIDWTNYEQYELDINHPANHPLGNGSPFFLLDNSRKISPEYAAQCMIEGLLHCTQANQNGNGFSIVAYQVPEQKLFRREDIINRILSGWDSSIANNLSRDHFIKSAQSILATYPGLDEDMWLLRPDFSIQWTGRIMGVNYDRCHRDGPSDQAGLVRVQSLSSQAGHEMAELFLLIRQDNRYRLQSVAGFFAEFEKNAVFP
ncbi:MAG: hypothetical protein HFF49_01395 [Lawsonibacter sp.]|jgi:hypothetical protein|nr:hypothetical protein [Lawsonibacter sp.]